MTSWINQTRVVRQMADRLLSSQRINYQEDYIKYKAIECSHLRFYNHLPVNKYGEKLKTTVFCHSEIEPHCCVVYMHGFGSHRIEGVSILSALPKELALCCFDFSGSGKSEGEISTYGIKESEDIQPILTMLRQKYKFKKFILWGRSMGAVASLLYTSNLEPFDIVLQVLDSPFNSFQKIAHHHAKNIIKFPDLFIGAGMSIMKDHFKDHPYSPFKLQLNSAGANCKIPALFVYCEEDKIIPSENSLQIIQGFNKKTPFERLIIAENHNNFRSIETLNKIFDIGLKYWNCEKIRQKIRHKGGILQILSNGRTPKSSRNIMRLSGCIRRSISKNRNSKLITQESTRNPQDEVIPRVFCFRSCSKPQQ